MAVYGYAWGKNVSAINSQKDLIKDFSSENGMLINTFYQDTKKKGLSFERTGMEDLQDVFVRGDVLIISSFSRLNMNAASTQDFLDLMKEKGVSLKVIDIKFDTVRDGYDFPIMTVMSYIPEGFTLDIGKRNEKKS